VERDPSSRPEQLGQFQLIEKIGEGGMGIVHKAWDTRLERVVALKLVPRDLLGSDRSRARLLREAKIASALNHPNIATIHGLEEANGRDLIVMEYVEGPTLRKRLREGPMAVREVLDVAVSIADALGEAHGQGVVHRDIKPENIILTPRGHPKVMDFGLAKLTGPLKERDQEPSRERAITKISTDGIVMGTVAYMSPEQAAGRPVDARADIFSFGVVLYEMLTGRKAFAGDSDVDVLYQILHDAPRPVSDLNPDVPSDLQAIVARCTAKEREGRYPAGRDLCEELKRARISLDIQRARTLHTLFSISREMTSILDLEPLLDRICILVRSLIDYDMMGIFRVDERADRLYWEGGAGYDPEKARRTEYIASRGVCGRAIRTREAIRVGDVTADPDYYPPNGKAFASNMAVPLVHGDRVVGVLNMESRRPHFFTHEHLTVMSTLAGVIGVAMENARIFEELRQQGLAMQMLHDIGREFASILDLDYLLGKVGELTRKVIDHELFALFLLEEGTGHYNWCGARGYHPDYVRDTQIQVGEGIISRAVQRQEAIVVDDVRADPDYVQPRTVDGRVPLSEVAVPLVVQDRVLGVLVLESVEAGRFKPEHTRLLSILASQIAVAVENAQLYGEIRDRAKRREQEAEKVRRRFESYVTPHIAEQVFSDPKGKLLAGERRQVTVLVADIRGFTAVAEALPPEVTVTFLQEFFSVMTHVLFKYEGTVDKLMGDAIMAVYGAPIAHDPRYGPSDPQRAVFAAIDMRDAFGRLRDKWWAKHSELGGLELSVGINTGATTMGNMGSDRRVEYTAIGTPVNVAFQLCREAAPGEIRVGGETSRFVKEDVQVEPLGEARSSVDPKARIVLGLKYLT
jgi:serine/threonine protein kinase/class 3 adenylate cyclase